MSVHQHLQGQNVGNQPMTVQQQGIYVGNPPVSMQQHQATQYAGDQGGQAGEAIDTLQTYL